MIDHYKQGYDAYNAGQHLWENPYYNCVDTDASFFQWFDGYKDAEAEFLNEES